VRRVAAVREAVGPDVKLYVDANCGLDLFHATELAHRIEPYGISFFEEPLTQNDVRQMAQLRSRTRIRWRAARTRAWPSASATCW